MDRGLGGGIVSAVQSGIYAPTLGGAAAFGVGTQITDFRSGIRAAVPTVIPTLPGLVIYKFDAAGLAGAYAKIGMATLPYLQITAFPSTVASVALPTSIYGRTAELAFAVRGVAHQAQVRIPQLGFQAAAALVASGAGNLAGTVNLVLYQGAGAITSAQLEIPAGASPIGPRDYLFADAIQNQSYRMSAASVYRETVSDVQHGALPQIGPSAAAVAFIYHPQHGGTANDLLSAGVSVRERFSYAS